MDAKDRIGELIGDAARRADWRDFVSALHEAALPGGPLEGHLFHGTCEDAALSIAEQGVTTTESMHPDEDDDWVTGQGTHWGIAKVAAFYAEDRIESRDDPDLKLAIVAVRKDALAECGPFAVDGQTLDCPLYTRLGRPEADTDAAWETSAKDWKACLDAYGTLLVLGAVGPEDLRILRSADDVRELVSEILPSPSP